MLLVQKPKLSLQKKSMREERQRLREVERQPKGMETTAAKHQRANDELQNLRNKREQTQAKIDALDEEHGSESDKQRMELLKEKYEDEFVRIKK